MDIVPFLPLVIIGITSLVGLRAFIIGAPEPLKKLSRLWLVLFAVEISGLVLKYVAGKPNKWLFNVFYIFFFLYLASIFARVLESNRVQTVIGFFYFAFIAFAIINAFFIQDVREFHSLTYVVGGIFSIYLSGAYLWQMVVSPDNDKVTRDPFFWVSFALVVYFGCTVPFYGMFNYLETYHYEFTVFYHTYISNTFSIVLNVLIMTAFLCRKRFPKSFSY